MIGTKLGHYEVSRHLGTGGMGEVYQAIDSRLGRNVAIKLLPEAFRRDTERMARFEREAKLLASLNHPNIAGIYGLEDSGETRFLVLELVEGDTLADRLQGGAIAVHEALKLALQIAQALEAAHEKGIIHRDIKPANIKITPDGKIKVLDFGLAKAFLDERDVNLSNSPTMSIAGTQQGMIMGTAGYMSPEQASGQSADKRADIWSFGVVLFEMLTGRRMFTGKTVSHVLADVLRSDPDWKGLPPNIHPRIRLLLERCLEKEARDRYHDVADARVDIEHVLADPQGVFIQSTVETGQKQAAGFRQVLPWVIAASLIAGVIGWFVRPSPPAKPQPVVRFPLSLPETVQLTNTPGRVIAISSDGTRIAYTANNQVYLHNLNEAEARPVPGTNEGLAGDATPVFSPDGRWIAYVHLATIAGPYFIKRVPVTGGTPVQVYASMDRTEYFTYGLTWPTADTIVFSGNEGIIRMPANGGAAEILVKRGAREMFDSPQLLPDGKSVLFVRLGEDPGSQGLGRWDGAQVVIQTIGRDDRTVIWERGSQARYLPTGHLVYAQGNTLFALSVDVGSRKVVGGPVPILEGIQRSSNGFTGAAQYSVSDSGVLAAIPGTIATSTEKGVLALLDRKGATTPLRVRTAQYRGPRFSPDGQHLAVEILNDEGTGSSIWIYDISGKSEIRRLTEAGKNSVRPIWSFDGKSITFASNRDGTWGIYEQPADGSTLAQRLTTAKDKVEHYPESWSPDGKTLAFVEANTTADWNLETFSRDGKTVLIAGGIGNQFGSSFSPDGKWLVYTDNQSPFGIRAQPFPPTGVIHQVTQDGEAWPIWSAGGQVFFRLRRDANGPPELRAFDVTTSGGFVISNPRSLQLPPALMFQGYRDFDVTRNGDKFVIIVPEEKAARAGPAPRARIEVVLNWFEELKQRVHTR